jgi:hypothetical protein
MKCFGIKNFRAEKRVVAKTNALNLYLHFKEEIAYCSVLLTYFYTFTFHDILHYFYNFFAATIKAMYACFWISLCFKHLQTFD